jgi:ER lumen protein retaining receptor
VIDSFYLVTLGSYRAFYILNWIVRGAVEPGYKDPTSWTLDFAWVYWTRQRVKLRQGGVVDSDDLSRGWLVGRILGRKSGDFDEEEAPAVGGRNGAARRGPGRWGARGISVSADEDVHDARKKRGQGEESEPLTDPNAFEDDLDDDDEDIPAAAPSKAAKADKKKSTSDDSDDGHESGVSGGEEWRDDHQGR